MARRKVKASKTTNPQRPSPPRGARRPRRREAEIAFEALSIEGGLLSPEWLSKVAQLAAGQQTEADYRVPKGLNLRDEIGRYWRIAQALWADLAAARSAAASGGGDPAELARRFVTALLRECFGFGSLAPVAPVVIDERTYPIGHAALAGRVPVVIAPAGFGLSTPDPSFGDGTRRRDAFGLTQEYLNAADDALWGIACDADTLRIVRDNASLTRPAWIEADLARIFREERYADFTALWLLAHETRFGREGLSPADCPLEVWREAGRQEGTRARDKLRGGVKDALEALGQGFLTHPDNGALRAALHSGALTRAAYFQQLLRLVYRLIFLLTVEERDLLHPRETPDAVRRLYAEGYGLRRLRERSVRRSAHDRHGDLWAALQIVFRGLATGEPRLGLPALGGLFDPARCPALDGARLENRALLLAMFRLSWLREDAGLARVNWRDMGPEELGSVYESLLELVPEIAQDGRTFRFATGDATKGNARKSTGSYYTPDGLVQVLLDSALEPVIKETVAAHPTRPVEALLELSIVDPACGSGHFLLAAARRLAAHVARLQANGSPSAAEYRRALRQVVSRCIYGVDLNELAVELCKVSLWMEAVEPGLPLTFLDSHIRHGNALLGATRELMKEGVPDEAWNPIEGDDRKVASALKKRNRKAVEGQRSFEEEWSKVDADAAAAVAKAVAELDATPDTDPQGLASKESRWRAIQDSPEHRYLRLVADAWCSAFVWPKQPGPLTEVAPTNDVWWGLRDRLVMPPELLVRTVTELRDRYRFFHWHLEFPHVFARGGFDVVLGNPPWEHVEIKEQEWFAERDPAIANAPNAAARKRMIEALRSENPQLYDEFRAASRRVDAENHLARASGRFPLCARGRINTYALFAEHNRSVIGPRGRAGFVVPTGIATDDTTKDYFSALVEGKQLARFLSFENEEYVFPGVHHAFRFALLVIDRSGRSECADLVFFARRVSDLADPDRHVQLSPADFATLNPNTRTCPTFRSRRDAELNLKLYRRAGVLWRDGDEDGNPWRLSFMQGTFNTASDSHLFRTAPELEGAGWRRDGNHYVREGSRAVPLVEAKMVHQFDHRFGTYEGQSQGQANQGKLPELDDTAHADVDRLTLPRYWVEGKQLDARLEDRWTRGWMLGWRDICRSTDQRTVIASLIPRSATGHTFLLAMPDVEAQLVACLYANLCAFVLDYAARQKVGGTHVSYHVFKQLPVLRPRTYAVEAPWAPGRTVRDWVLPRVLELTYTAHDLEPFARDCGFEGPPFRWEPERRFLLRAELDAAFFHLYGVSRDDVDYVLDTFPIVRKEDERAHGEYRTKRAILEVYDAMARAIRERTPYRSPVVDDSKAWSVPL